MNRTGMVVFADPSSCNANHANVGTQILTKTKLRRSTSESILKSITQMCSIPCLDFSQNSTAQPIFALLEEIKAFLRRTRKMTGDIFCRDSSGSHFRRQTCRKNVKSLCCVGSAETALRARQGEIFQECFATCFKACFANVEDHLNHHQLVDVINLMKKVYLFLSIN